MAKEEKLLKLNLGCGFRHFAGWLNVDKAEICDPDMQVDLEETPWPWEDNSVGEVRLFNVLEQVGSDLPTFVALMKELYRVCRHGAHIHIISSHPRSDAFLSDPCSCRAITVGTLRHFDKSVCEAARQQGVAFSPLALQHELDLRVVTFKHTLDGKFVKLAQQKKWSAKEIQANLELFNNAIASTELHLIVVKDATDKSRYALAQPLNIAPYLMAVQQDLNADREVSGAIAANGQWQPVKSAVFTKLLGKLASERKNLRVMIAGATIGWYPLLAAKCADNINVDCFEPFAPTAEILKHNLELHQLTDRVNVSVSALSDAAGQVKFYLDKNNLAMGALAKYQEGLEESEVPADTLDNMFKGKQLARLPEVLMLDVQGCEQKVLDGAQKLFERGWRPLIFVEINPGKLQAFNCKAQFTERLTEQKYSLYAVGTKGLNLNAISAGQVAKFCEDTIKSGHKERYMSLLCVPEGVDIKALLH